jgi:hypothetical protein
MWMSIPAAATWTVAVLLGSTHQAQQRDIASLVSPASIVAVSCDDVPALRSALLQNSWFHAFTAPESPFRSMAGPDAREIDEMVAVLSTNRTPEQLAMMDDDAQKIASVLDALRGGAGFWVVMPDDFEGNPVMGVLLRTDAATNELVSRISAWIAESEEKEAVAEPFRGSDWMRIDSQRDTLTLVGGLEGFTTLLVGPAERVEAERAALHARITTPGRRGGLHENQRHVEAMRALTVQGQVTVTADLSTLMAFARRSMEADMGTGEDAVAMQRAVDRSGVFRLGWAGMRMGVGAGERAEGEFVLDVPAQTFLAEVLDLMRPIPMALRRTRSPCRPRTTTCPASSIWVCASPTRSTRTRGGCSSR